VQLLNISTNINQSAGLIKGPHVEQRGNILNFNPSLHARSSAKFHSRLKTDLFKLFYNYTILRNHSPPLPIATIVPRCLLGLTFPDFDLAQKRENDKFGY